MKTADLKILSQSKEPWVNALVDLEMNVTPQLQALIASYYKVQEGSTGIEVKPGAFVYAWLRYAVLISRNAMSEYMNLDEETIRQQCHLAVDQVPEFLTQELTAEMLKVMKEVDGTA